MYVMFNIGCISHCSAQRCGARRYADRRNPSLSLSLSLSLSQN